MWRNDTKCKYMFMFPLKNLACKGLCNFFSPKIASWHWWRSWLKEALIHWVKPETFVISSAKINYCSRITGPLCIWVMIELWSSQMRPVTIKWWISAALSSEEYIGNRAGLISSNVMMIHGWIFINHIFFIQHTEAGMPTLRHGNTEHLSLKYRFELQNTEHFASRKKIQISDVVYRRQSIKLILQSR